jgi:hypothetical protein
MKIKLAVLAILASTLLSSCLLRPTYDDDNIPAIDPEVTIINSSAKSITEFALAGVAGNISGLNISVTVPYGTDITHITPYISYIGISISPSVGPTDFSSPVNYTITAYDGSTQTYTVTVFVADSSAKSITSFEILGNLGSFSGPNGTNVVVMVPYGTNVNSLTPNIAISGVSISPLSE